MDMYRIIHAENLEQGMSGLRAGDQVLLSGTIYSARDAAHERVMKDMENGGNAPFPIKNSVIYYAGPCPAKPGRIAGPYGPTTSGRMDKYTPFFLDHGVKIMIGKGERSAEVVESMKRNGAVYLAAIGGCGAAIASIIEKQEIVAYGDLGAEAIYRLEVKDFPLIVAIDVEGNNIFLEGRETYAGRYTQLKQKEK